MLTSIKAALQHFREAVPFRLGPALITTAVLFALLLIPGPEGLTPKAWGLVAIFLTTIVAIILKVMPIGVMAMMISALAMRLNSASVVGNALRLRR